MARSKFEKMRGGRAKALPLLSAISFIGTVRLIPSKYSVNEDSVLARLTPDNQVLQDGFEVESRTNDRLIADLGLLPGISLHELVANVPYASVINASFTHARPDGARFNGPDRGAWYAARGVRTAQAEVAYHQTTALWEIQKFEDEMTYDEYLADFRGDFHDLRIGEEFVAELDPDSYVESQSLAERLLGSGSLGVVYPSVRHAGGVCLVCFRPALITHVRKGRTFRFRWSGHPKPTIEAVSR